MDKTRHASGIFTRFAYITEKIACGCRKEMLRYILYIQQLISTTLLLRCLDRLNTASCVYAMGSPYDNLVGKK